MWRKVTGLEPPPPFLEPATPFLELETIVGLGAGLEVSRGLPAWIGLSRTFRVELTLVFGLGLSLFFGLWVSMTLRLSLEILA